MVYDCVHDCQGGYMRSRKTFVVATFFTLLMATGSPKVVHAQPTSAEDLVILCSGQSNMSRARPGSTLTNQYPLVNGWRRKWGRSVAGACFWAGVEISEYTGNPVYLVNEARPGSKILYWMPGGEGFEERIRPLPAEHSIDAVIWWQGERELRDGPGSVAVYADRLTEMVDAWSGLWGYVVPWAIYEVPTGLPPYNENQSAMKDQYAAAIGQLADNGVPAELVLSRDIDGGVHPKDVETYGRRAGRVIINLLGL